MTIQFNFGPIARTDAGGTHDTINLASLPLHVMLNALVASTSPEEFIAWLWHDLYKPAFYWVNIGRKDKSGNDQLNWYHTPGRGAFSSAEGILAAKTSIQQGLVSTHHDRNPQFALRETDFISDQGDQVNLGATVNYVQLSIASEPALATVLVRSVIANAFIEVVAKSVATALRNAFIQDKRTPIDQVRFEFSTIFPASLSSLPNDTEIWNKVGRHFDVQYGSRFVMRHLTPVTKVEHQAFATTFTADLTGDPLLPSQMLDNVVSLAELLVVYQDSRTVIIAVPQQQLYTIDLAQIRQSTFDATRSQLNSLNVLTIDNGTDYLKAAFDVQVNIREVPGRQSKRTTSGRPLADAVLHASGLLSQARSHPAGKICRITGTPFVGESVPNTSSLRLDQLFSSSFVDTEFLGISGDIAPLTYLYILNSPNAGGAGQKGVPKRTSMRGAFALLYNGPRNLDSQKGKNKVPKHHAQTLQCHLQGRSGQRTAERGEDHQPTGG